MIKTLVVAVGGAVAVAGVVAAATVNANDDAQVVTGAGSAMSSPVGFPGDLACSPDAVPDLSQLDAGTASMAADNQVAQRLSTQVDREAIVYSARRMSSDGPVAVGARAAAVKVPYSTAAGWLVDSNELVSPARCVWVVTVEAPFEPRSVRAGATAVTYTGYTAMFDAASGEYLGVNAGPGLVNVVTGANLPK